MASQHEPIMPANTDFSTLFTGAARLGMVLAALDIPWPTVIPYVRRFPEELNGYLEISMDPQQGSMGLMTRSSGKDYAFRVARSMELDGVHEASLRRFLVLSRHFAHTNLFYKVEFGSDGSREHSCYFRRRPPLDVALTWLQSYHAPPSLLERVQAVARMLHKRTVHFLGVALPLGGAPVLKVYFSQSASQDSWGRVRAVAHSLGLSDADWSPLEAQRAALSGHTLFLSLGVADGALLPGLKLDVHGVDTDPVAALMAAAGATPEPMERLGLLPAVFEQPRHDYVGIRLTPGEPMRFKVYAYQDTR